MSDKRVFTSVIDKMKRAQNDYAKMVTKEINSLDFVAQKGYLCVADYREIVKHAELIAEYATKLIYSTQLAMELQSEYQRAGGK